jgi:hypothetical protein
MPAYVGQDPDVAVGPPHDDEGILAHRDGEVVPRVGDVRSAAYAEPLVAPDRVQLELVERVGVEDLRW